jgi:hypothetical protein
VDIANYALASFVVSVGIFCGAILGHIAKEELKPGRKYLAAMQNAVLAAVAVLLVYFGVGAFASVFAAFIFLLAAEKTKITNPHPIKISFLAYAVLALAFFEAAASGLASSGFIALSSLAFIYGFPTGSIIFIKKRWKRKAFAAAAWFFCLSLGFYFLLPILPFVLL